MARGATLGSAVFGLLALAGGARGQDPARPDSAAAGDSARVYAHEAITVRALRAPLPLASLPFSVTVRRPGEDIPGAGLTLAEALRAVPGLQVQSRYNDALGDRIVMRGFGARAQFGVRGIHVLVDGVPATMADGQTALNHVDLGALEGAEILRGPGAAAYGNAAGGVLLLWSTPPPSAGVRARASSVAGSDGLVRLHGTAGSGSGSAGWIASVSREWRDGYRPHSGTDRWQLTGRMDAPFGGGFLRVVTHGAQWDADNPGSLTPEQYAADPHQAQAFNVSQGTGEAGRHGQVGVTWERAVAGARLEATGWGLGRTVANPIPPAIIDVDRVAMGFRALLRRGGGEGPGWAAGMDASLLRDERVNHDNDGGARGALTLDQTERVANVGAHAQTLIPLLPRADLFLAARYDRVRFSADDRFIGAGDPDDSGQRTMDAFSPTAGIRFAASERLDVYANVSTAFETPTTTELVNRPDGAGGFNPSLEPQRTVSWEAGARAVLGALRLEASAYHATVRDALIPFEVESAPGRQYFRNAAGARHRGAELSAELRRGPLQALGAFALTDAAFTDFRTPDGDFAGLAVPGVRPWTAEVGIGWHPEGRPGVLLSYQGAGAMVVDDANLVEAPGHSLLGMRATVPLRLGGIVVALHGGVENLLDEAWVASVVPNAFGGRYYEPGPGRSLHLGAAIGAGGSR